MKKDLVLSSVQNSVSSIFSKEDVINLINSIELESSRKITTEDIQRAIDKTINWVEHNEDELLDLDSAELEMDYSNRVSVVGVPLNTDSLREALENNFMDFGEEVEEEVEVKEERTSLVELAEFRATGDL
jgi:hypothetical protein